MTGAPGWLANAFLRSLGTDPIPGLTDVRCLVQQGATPLDADWERVEGDLRDAASLVLATRGVDRVLHAAGVLHVRRTREWYDVNAGGTEALLAASAAAGVRRFVLISSNAAAGRSGSRAHALTEEDSPHPLSHYGKSKLLAELAAKRYADRIEMVTLRPCMFYGPPVPKRHIDVYRVVASGRMPMVGGGNFARSVTYIDNLVQACRLTLMHQAAAGKTYYVSDGPIYTTRAVVEAMATALGVAPRFIKLPRIVAPLAYRMDMALARTGLYWQDLHLLGEADWHVGVSCDKARRELGYEPSVNLGEGMRRAVEWCRATGRLN